MQQQKTQRLEVSHEQEIENYLKIFLHAESAMERKQASEALIVIGDVAIPQVIPHALREHKRRDEVVMLLTLLGSNQAIGLLIAELERRQFPTEQDYLQSKPVIRLLEELVEQLSPRMSEADIPLFLHLIQLSSQHIYFSRAGRIATKGLITLAERQPSVELREALGLLRAGFVNPHAPLEFIPLHLRLARALKRCSGLPIPASAPSSFAEAQNLPLPTKEKQS
jgi:hypothetical protein